MDQGKCVGLYIARFGGVSKLSQSLARVVLTPPGGVRMSNESKAGWIII